MSGKRKKRKLDFRKLIIFIIFAAAVLVLPTRYVVDGLRNSGVLSRTGSRDEIGYAASGAGAYIKESTGYPGGTPAAETPSSGANLEASPTEAQVGARSGSMANSSLDASAGESSVISSGSYQNSSSGASADASSGAPSGAFPETPSGESSDKPPETPPGISSGTDHGASPGLPGDALSDASANTEAILPDTSRNSPSGAYKYSADPGAEAGAGAGADPGAGDLSSRDAPPENIVVTISAVGDCTIGYDETFGYQNRFDQVYAANNNNPAYFFENVVDIFTEDDLTIANLESVFTDAKKKADKAYRFKGPPEYVRILEEGGVDAVNLANNHMFDYFQKGYEDTIETLDNSTVEHFGYDRRVIIDIRGVKVGLAGFHIGGGGWSGKKKAVTDTLDALRAETDLIIISFHWGIEGKYKPSEDQRSLARYAIDNGADLVLGHHPHTLQPVETYNGRTIAYSLGNFCFGGNRNPGDKDTIILRQSFEFDGTDFRLIEALTPEIIPASVSSVRDRNDYRPTVVEGDAAERTLKKAQP